MKRTRYKPGPLTADAMREWMEFEQRRRGAQERPISERDRRLAKALVEAERDVDPSTNAIQAPEEPAPKQYKPVRRKPKMLPDDAKMFKARRHRKRD